MCKVNAITNRKGSVEKTITTANPGIGIDKSDKQVQLIDANSQGSLTASHVYVEPDEITVSPATIRL